MSSPLFYFILSQGLTKASLNCILLVCLLNVWVLQVYAISSFRLIVAFLKYVSLVKNISFCHHHLLVIYVHHLSFIV